MALRELLKLPPAIRAIAISRRPGLVASFTACPRSPQSSWKLHAPCVPLQPPPRYRQYATVHNGDTEKLWSEHGKVATIPSSFPSNGQATPLTPIHNSTCVEIEVGEQTLAPFQHLKTLWQRYNRANGSVRRRKIKARITEALEGVDPTTALRQLYEQPHLTTGRQRLGQAAATDTDSPSVTAHDETVGPTEALHDYEAHAMIHTAQKTTHNADESGNQSLSATKHESHMNLLLRHLAPPRNMPYIEFKARIDKALESVDPASELKRLAEQSLAGNLRSDEQPEPAEIKADGVSAPTENGSVGPVGAAVQLLDLSHIQRTKPLPTRADYPKAPDLLFKPDMVSVAVNDACQKLKISMQSELSYATKKGLSFEDLQRLQPGLVQVYVCTLNLELVDICQVAAVGEGPSKANSKRAAWLHAVSNMHADGTLRELFPDVKASPKKETAEQLSAVSEIEATEVDQQTLEDEKDAKMEIYNYAASLGLIPQFEIQSIQPRTSRRQRGLTAKKPALVFQACIRLPEHDIDVTAIGKDIQTAEVAAALTFKQQAETKYSTREEQTPPSTRIVQRILNTTTASQFFEFYKIRVPGTNFEMEHDFVGVGGENLNSARLTINGSPVGQTAVMKTKHNAESAAYLTAALEVSTRDPELLQDFKQTLKKGNGKVLRSLTSIDIPVEYETLDIMRKSLLEARSAGLPDAKQTLSADVLDLTNRPPYRQKKLSPHEFDAANAELFSRYMQHQQDPNCGRLRAQRSTLPMTGYREQVVSMVSDNLYSIIVGATGSGKTTQVPQILFEDAIARGQGSSCNIICTQPRRIAATSVAHRVAAERNEALRKTVGYHIRFDAKMPYEPYGIAYCTTGILLERLKHDPDGVLDSVSHLIIDEVHERDIDIDFLLIVLRKALRTRQNDRRPVPRVVLMSATIDTDLFARYFGQIDDAGNLQPCPSLSVPGRMFPVRNKFLGSVLHEMLLKHGPSVKTLIDEDPVSSGYLKAETAFSESQSKENLGVQKGPVIDWKRQRSDPLDPEEDGSAAAQKEEALVPTSLLAATIAHVCTTSNEGAVLAFLPGLEEITKTERTLLERQPFGVDFNDESKFQICLLHSTVPKEDQARVFEPSPPGCRKIILSTNIAETSVTVPEVKYVVDTGKLREVRYDQTRRITGLQCVWQSKSNSTQRAGRAGRVQDGYYYALFSKERNDTLRSIQLPALLRSDLQETCLAIKAQKFNEPVASFLAQAIEPPPKLAVETAIKNLIAIQAYTADEELTSLGRLLSQLPVHPSLGKMIVLGVIFRCLDPMIVLGAAAEHRPLWVRSITARAEAERSRRSYAGDSQSDHIALIEAFDELRQLQHDIGMDAAIHRAQEKFLHMGAYAAIDQTARQIEEILADAKLISRKTDHEAQYGPVSLNRNSGNTELIKCLLVAGFHPNLAAKTSSKGLAHRTPLEDKVLIYPASLNAEITNKALRHPYGTLLTYNTLSRSNDGVSLFLQDSSIVTPLMAILFGGRLSMTSNATLEMDEWIPFFVKYHDKKFATRLILEFRKALDRILNSAFSSLSDLNANSDQEGQDGFVDDPIRDKFADRVIEILQHAKGGRSVGQWTNAFRTDPAPAT